MIGLDSVQLKYDKKKDQNFKDYVLSYIQSLSDNEDNLDFSILLKDKIKGDFKIEQIDMDDDLNNENRTNEDEDNLNIINSELESKYYETIDIGFYLNMKTVYNSNNKYSFINKKIFYNFMMRYLSLTKLINRLKILCLILLEITI